MSTIDLALDRYRETRQLLDRLQSLLANHAQADRLAVQSAADWMVELHADQAPRPDGTPYINHPLEVCLGVIDNFGFDERAVLVAALLHDSVEDQADKMAAGTPPDGDEERAALQAIETRYGARAAELVAILTNPNWDQVDDRAESNRLYREHFREIPHKDPVAFAIKLADFSTNALRLDQVKDEKKFRKLSRKYCPVMADAVDYLASVPDTGHVLSQVKGYMLPRLDEAIEKYCSP